jgi:small subunit ribosomal protein S17
MADTPKTPDDAVDENATTDAPQAEAAAPESEVVPSDAEAVVDEAPAEEPATEPEPPATEPVAAEPEPEPEPEPVAEAPAAEPEPVAEEPAAEPEPEPEPPAVAPAPPAQEAASSEPVEQLTSKQRRRRERSTHTGSPRESRSPEERHAERASERLAKAKHRRATRAKARSGASKAKPSEPQVAVVANEPAPRGAPKVRQGVVVSDKPDKTITVRISSVRQHRRYGKIVRSSRTLHAHDDNNEAREGDVVSLVESRPLSRTKRWRLAEILERAQ